MVILLLDGMTQACMVSIPNISIEHSFCMLFASKYSCSYSQQCFSELFAQENKNVIETVNSVAD